MSDVARQKRLFLLVLLFFALFFVVGYTSRLVKKNQMEQEVRTWQTRIVQAQQKGVVLAAELARVQSEAYTHEKARETLGLVQPADTLLVEVERLPSTQVATVSADPVSAPQRAEPTWQQWLQLFLPGTETTQ